MINRNEYMIIYTLVTISLQYSIKVKHLVRRKYYHKHPFAMLKQKNVPLARNCSLYSKMQNITIQLKIFKLF